MITLNKNSFMRSCLALLLVASVSSSSEAYAFLNKTVNISSNRKALKPSFPTASRELFLQAYLAYSEARPVGALGKGSDPYARAIHAIAQAVAMEPENVDYLFLASQIYRGKGGISMAKDYFLRAEKLLQERIKADPESIGTNLDYAILCYAGDARYWKECDAYLKKAQVQANRVLSLCKKREGDEGVRIPMAWAYLVKGNAKECEKILSSSKLPATRFYLDLYKDTVKKGKWFWPAKDPGRELLLYYMTDGGRYLLP